MGVGIQSTRTEEKKRKHLFAGLPGNRTPTGCEYNQGGVG